MKYWLRIFAVNCGATVLIVAGSGSFGWQTFLIAFIVSNAIGALCGLLMPSVLGHRPARFPASWIAVAGMLLVITVGTFLVGLLITSAVGHRP